MATNLLELFQSAAGKLLIVQSGSILGESAESTSIGVNTVSAALLSSIIHKGSTERGAREIKEYMTSNNIDESLIQNVPNLLDDGPSAESLKAHGGDAIKFLLGDKVSGLVDMVAGESGLKTSSASTLLKIVAPLLLSLLARESKEKSWNASGLNDYLRTQKPLADNSGSANINRFLGFDASPTDSKIAHGNLEVSDTTSEPERSTLSKLLPWIVLLIAALGLFYFLEKGGEIPPADLEKMKRDSLENVRKADSIRNATAIDTVNQAIQADTVR